MRIPVPIAGSVKIVDTTGIRRSIRLQNPSAQDIFVSEDQQLINSVSLTNLPTVGILLPANAPGVFPMVVPYDFAANLKLFARSQNAGAELEVQIFECDCPQQLTLSAAA